MQKARNFREYKVWQDAVSFAIQIYNITAKLPWFEKIASVRKHSSR